MADTNTTPAYKTVAFWAALVMTNLGLLGASGLISVLPHNAQLAISWAVVILSALGYGAARANSGELPPPPQ